MNPVTDKLQTDDHIEVANVVSEPEKTKAPAAKQKSSGRGLLWLLVLLLIVGLASASGYFYLQLQQQKQNLSHLQSALAQSREAQSVAQQQLETQVDQQLQQARQQLDSQQQDLAMRLDALASRVLAMGNVDRDEWKLVEAEHLLRMANQRVLQERSGTNALALAQQVDDILRGFSQGGVHDVRRTLANEMAELRLIGDVDREGIYLRLMAVAQQVEKMSILSPLGDKQDNWDSLDEETEKGLWASIKRGTRNLLRRFSDHIRVRDHGTDTSALLPPDAPQYLKLNVRLMLEQAQTALLREEAQIYQASLAKAQLWLTDYFPLNDEVVNLQAELTALQELSVAPSLPDFTQSAEQLRQYIQMRNARALGGGSAQ